MRQTNLPDPEYLRQRLDYDAETGRLLWLPNPSARKCWNVRWAGREAFTAIFKGYRTGRLDGVQYLAHRLAWAWHTGVWPTEQVDHINGNRSDNRMSNLRLVSNTENARNCGLSINNTSGVNGVWFDKRRSCWVAEIKVDRKKIYLGGFPDLDAAATARRAAETRYGFHANHGKRRSEK